MNRYDTLEEVRKHDTEAKTLEEILKFNPYHDALGRFASANGATSFTFRTNSPAGQKAIANIKAKQKAAAAGGGGGSSSSTDSKKPATKPKTTKPKTPKGNQKKQTEHPEGKYGTGWEKDEEGMVNKAAEVTGIKNKEKVKGMVDAAHDFTGSHYDDIRKYERDGPPPNMKETSDRIQKFIEASPKWDGGEVSRGIGVDQATANKIISDAKKGKKIGMLGTSSWSTDESVARSFAESQGEDVTIIFKSKGKQNGTSVRYLSKFPSEDEVLMSNSARWKPTDVVEESPGYWVIYCDPAA